MADQDLRALERAFAAGPTAAGRIELARALRNAGQVDRARELLVGGREDREVRRALFALTYELDRDPLPIAKAPAPLWSRPNFAYELVPTPEGLIAFGGGGAAFHDADTGEMTHRMQGDSAVGSPTQEGDLLLYPGREALLVYDLAKKKRVAKHAWPGPISSAALFPGGVLAACGGRLHLLDHQERTKPPTPRWSFALNDGQGFRAAPMDDVPPWEIAAGRGCSGVPSVDGDLVLASTLRDDLYAFDLATGALRWRVDGVHHAASDGAGVLASRRGHGPSLLGRDGAACCELAATCRPIVFGLGPNFILAGPTVTFSTLHTPRIAIFDRANGRVRAELGWIESPVLAVARDTIYVAANGTGKERRLIAFSPDGQERWSVRVSGPKAAIRSLVPAWGRLYMLFENCRGVCWAEPS